MTRQVKRTVRGRQVVFEYGVVKTLALLSAISWENGFVALLGLGPFYVCLEVHP